MTRSVILIFLAFSFVFCVKTHTDPVEEPRDLELLHVYDLNIEGPSGLSKSNVPDHLYTVCDSRGRIYLISTEGQILLTLNIGGDDLEGIVFVEEKLSLYVLEEKKRMVIRLTLGGQVLDTFKLDIPMQNINDGPEGITWNPLEEHFYVVNEKNPAILYVYDTLFQKIDQYPLSFAKDYSALDYDPTQNKLWILSQESKILARCNLRGDPEILYNTNVPDGEGLVIDMENERIYIVCDDTSRLFVFRLPEQN